MENEKFLRVAADIGVVAATVKVQVALEDIRAQFGQNLNTLIIKNTDVVPISIDLDGHEVRRIEPTDSFSFDWQDGINYSILEITNKHAVTATTANKIFITIGRTGLK